MYQIKCDDYILHNPKVDELIVESPKCKLEVNTVGEASFAIYTNHPYYDKLHKLKSIFEIKQGDYTIFRGRMTDDSYDFYNKKAVDLEGAMAFFNDSRIKPFNFPKDFLEDADYIAASESGNVVEFFLDWIIKQHNAQVQPFQQLKIGTVTVADPNNYITRSESEIKSSWEVLKTKLFESALGGYLCIRYEEDGNYIDYLSDLILTNTQKIEFGENLLDLKDEYDAKETYSAVMPQGATLEGSNARLTIEALPDGEITNDIVKVGDTLYSKQAVEAYGFIYAPQEAVKWDDVTEASTLQSKAVEYLSGTAIFFQNTMEIKAIDLSMSDGEIASFRVGRKVQVESAPHGISAVYNLTMLDIDMAEPQNTVITVGETVKTLTDKVIKEKDEAVNEALDKILGSVNDKVESSKEEIREIITEQHTEITASYEEFIIAALASYVETGSFDEFREYVETQLSVTAGNIDFSFSTVTEQITNVNGDLQAVVERLNKNINFSDNGITITGGEGGFDLNIDNDTGITFLKDGVQFGSWDGVDFHTGNIVIDVDEKAQFGNFAFIPRSDGSLMFLKVGG